MKRLFIIITLFLSCCHNKDIKKIPPIHHVDIKIVSKTQVAYKLDYPATIVGLDDFPVISRVSGILFKQLYKEGSYVKKDQPLYIIDPRPFENQLKINLALKQKDEVASREYKIIYDRYNKLYQIGGVSNQELQTAKINYQNSLSQLNVDIANITNDKLNLQYTTVTSPIDGLISQRMVTVGSTITAFQTVLNNINSKDNLYANFALPENDRLELQNGLDKNTIGIPNNYNFNIDLELADGSTIESAGYVSFYDTRINPQNGTWNMRASINNKALHNKLLAGQFVHIYLNGANYKNVFALPQGAIFQDDKGAFVYVINNDNKVIKKNVITGKMLSDIWIINSGLFDNDKIIINGGMKVSVNDSVVVDNIIK
jgi:membrane fusion protein (multidrug efflux system)